MFFESVLAGMVHYLHTVMTVYQICPLFLRETPAAGSSDGSHLVEVGVAVGGAQLQTISCFRIFYMTDSVVGSC